MSQELLIKLLVYIKGEKLIIFSFRSDKNEYAGSSIRTVCPGSSDPPEKIFNIFASENEVYTIY